MIILDTNIVSEFMTSPPASQVLEWLNNQNITSLYLTTVTIAEISNGLNIMPKGKRHDLLAERFEQFKQTAFEQRILPFDDGAARSYGILMGHRRQLGRPMSTLDGQIAAIADANNCHLATRNIKDFEHCQITLINPFEPANQ